MKTIAALLVSTIMISSVATAENPPADQPSPANGQAAATGVVRSNSDFAIDLYRQLARENTGENLFFSPYSVSIALNMVAEGARGETAVEMGKVLRFPKSIRNTDTTVGTGVTITGYQIGSGGGALKPAAFSSAFGGAWQSAGLTANSIAELNPTANSVVGLGGSASMGAIYDPVSLETTFGTTPVSDLTFSYSRSDGRVVSAPVTYINTGLANTLVLQVDPTDGKARIVNDSVFNR